MIKRLKSTLLELYLLTFSTTTAFAAPPIQRSDSDILIPVPMAKQATDYTCGAAAALSIIGYFGGDLLESEVAEKLGTNNDYGTDFRVMEKFFKTNGYEVQAKDNMSIDELKNFILEGKPVLCIIQAWQDDVIDYTNYWGVGHYVIAIGMQDDKIIFQDPWILGHYGYMPAKEFESRWHQLTHENIKLNQWGMAISKEKADPFNSASILYIP